MNADKSIQPPVVVGIDGSDAAIEAALWATEEALIREVPLRLIYVVIDPAAPAPLAAVGNLRMELEYGETVLRRASAAITATGKPIKVETAMRRGSPIAELVAESSNAAMICIGSTGIGRIAKALFGSTATAVAESAHCPVAIIRAHRSHRQTDNAFIVAVVGDASDGDEVFQHALEEADLRRIPVLAVATSGQTSGDELERLTQNWGSRYPHAKLRTAVSQADVADFLTGFDWKTQIRLVVIGSGGTNQLTRLIRPIHPISRVRTEYSVLVIPSHPRPLQ
jgi:nucleotide-binding universal stress UspA family protein